MTPIQLYTYATPNGRKASIMLEETGLPYDVHVVDIERGDQHQPDFLALNRNNKIPVIVDPDRDRTIVESGVILRYLAERSGLFLPADADEERRMLQWMFFQAAHVGPMMGQLWHFKIFADETLPYAIGRYEREVMRIFRVLDGELATRDYLAGPDYGLADIMTWPWIDVFPVLGLSLESTPALQRWHAEIGAREAVRRGREVPRLRD